MTLCSDWYFKSAQKYSGGCVKYKILMVVHLSYSFLLFTTNKSLKSCDCYLHTVKNYYNLQVILTYLNVEYSTPLC
jgi:hypothetical protein